MSMVMDPELYKAATRGSCNLESFNLQQKTKVKENSALHLAAKFNQIDFVKKIGSDHPQVMAQLMSQRNLKGDTPLHIAARYGHSKIIEFLTNRAMKNTGSDDLEAAATLKNIIFALVNDKKDTALHDAVRNGHFDAVKTLMNCGDLESTKLCNGDGESPLFLAIDRKFFNIAEYIRDKSPECSCQGRGGMNVLHAVVIRTCPDPPSEDLLKLWIDYSKHPTSFMFDFLKASKGIWEKITEIMSGSETERMSGSNTGRMSDFLKASKAIFLVWLLMIHIFVTLPYLLLGIFLWCLLCIFYILPLFLWLLLNYCCKGKIKGVKTTKKRLLCLWKFLSSSYASCVDNCLSLGPSNLMGQEPSNLSNDETDVLQLLNEKFQVQKSDDELQWTPLHYAAHLRHKEAVKKLLNCDETVVDKKDKQGMSALHIAAKEGHVQIIKYIIKHYPATCELLDAKDRTILHVAVENGRYNVVKYILQSDDLEDLLNEQDNDGNTSLHYAAIHEQWSILKILVGDKRVDKGVFNKEGHVAHTYVLKMELRHFQKVHISKKMYKMGGPSTLKERECSQTKDNVGRKNSSSGDVVPKEDRKCQDIKEVGKNNILVITIMATITFAVGFQIPGGIDNGHSVSAQNGKLKYIFAAFQIANTLGFFSSLAAISIHFSASTEKQCGVYRHFIRFAAPLTHVSIWSTGVSYIMGTHLVITQHPLLAAANLAIFGCSVFLTKIVWFIR